MRDRLRDHIELTKPRLGSLVVFTTGVGLLVAPGDVGWLQAGLTIALTIGIVAASTTLNMYMERDVDHLMERTKDRPLPAGRLSPRAALVQGILLAAISVPLMAWLVNPLTATLGLGALLLYLGVYTPLKRRSVLSVYVGAVPGATPILMGWTSVTGRLDEPSLALFAILFLWQIPHFIAISLYRRDEYAAAGLKVLPVIYGRHHALWHMLGTAMGLVVAMTLPLYFQLGGPLYRVTALVLAAAAVLGTFYGMMPRAGVLWARRYFLVSLVYLPLLLGMLAADQF